VAIPFALYPWHIELDRTFEILKAEQERTTKELEGLISQEVRLIRQHLGQDKPKSK
jgi:hypothetical protein